MAYDYQIFPEEYFSGCDVTINIGNSWVDEVVAINFGMMEKVNPVYGYSSYTFDAMLRGNRIIQGNFRINFTEPNYIHRIIKEEMSRSSGMSLTFNDYASDRIAANDLANATANLKTAEQLKEFLKNTSGEKAKEMSEQFKNEKWKTDKTNSVKGAAGKTFFPDSQLKTFDIYLIYGSTMDGYIKRADLSRRFMVPSSAVYILKDVHIAAINQQIDGSGQPVYEDYSFFARDLSYIE